MSTPFPAPNLGFRGFVNALFRERPGRLAWVIAVQFAAGLGQAVGVLLLIPLLGAVGVTPSGSVAHWTRHVLSDVGIRPRLAAVLGIYVAVIGTSAVLSGCQTVLSTRYRLEFVDHLRGRLYAAVARAEWRHLMAMRQSDVLTVLTSNVEFVEVAAFAALNLVVATILVCAQLAAAFRVSSVMTALALATGTSLLLLVWPLIRRSRRLGAELVERNAGVMATATGFLDGLKLAKAYGREQGHVDAFTEAVAMARSSEVEFARVSGIASGIQATLTALFLGITVYLGLRVFRVPVSSLLVVAFVFTRVVTQLTAAQASIQHLSQGLPAFDQMMRLIASCEDAEERSARQLGSGRRVPIGEGISLHNVHFWYPSPGADPVEALRGVTIEVPAGSVVALAGRSGAGKTTIGDLAAGLVEPSAGCMTVDGEPLTPTSRLAWRLSVALVPQDPFLFNDTIDANLRWARPETTEAEIWKVLRMASAAEFVARLPGGLQAIVGDRGLGLSGGERQRLALARALLREPDLLILDEATSSLDTENELAIHQALGSIRGRTTILLIAHRLSTLREADNIIVLDAGVVVEQGSWEQLSERRAGRLQGLIAAGNVGVPPVPLTK